MQKTKKILIYLSVFLILIMPVVSLAAGLVPECPATGCGWTEIMALINNVIYFILYYMVIPIAAIMFAYAGFLLVTAGGEAAGARTKAKNIFTNAIFGLVISVAAWLIIKLVLSILGYKDAAFIGF